MSKVNKTTDNTITMKFSELAIGDKFYISFHGECIKIGINTYKSNKWSPIFVNNIDMEVVMI